MRVRIEGRQPLNGVYQPSGNANAAQALAAAALLSDQPVTLHRFPQSLSALSVLQQIESLGAQVDWLDHETVRIHAAQIARRSVIQGETDASVGALLIAPLLCRRQYARLELDVPLNRLRTHLEAMRDLGIDILVNGGGVDLKASPWDTRSVVLTQTSVTATALVLMLAAKLGRRTTIQNAASEPHVQDLARLLEAMGARIEGIGSNLLVVYGSSELTGMEVTIPHDYIEAASVAAMFALSGGRGQIDGVDTRSLRLISKIYWRLGLTMELDGGSLYVPRHDVFTVSNREEDVDASIETAPWPGFPSDLVAIATVIATQARGTSLIHEKLFSNRLLFVDKLKAMGAQIVLCDPHRVIVVGPSALRGAYLDTPDVRTGLGLLAAALAAEGETVIDNAQALEHTFVGVLGKLQNVHAKITIE
jgi:UDP-N-acetylglucosamine 1-carboxyvinyltransferase